ncbi:MAG TPA: S41 family peptidase [Burkholderiaceae bacterium]|nr:S41 family peptidase [Burkholderiaceae bacterium]
MRRLLRVLFGPVAACLLSSAGTALAAPPAISDELIAPVTSAYLRAVKPDAQADAHRELFAAVLRRVQQNYARDVDLPALIGAAAKAIEPLPPQSGEPAEVFAKAINAALATLDPHSRYLDERAQIEQRSALSGSFGGLGMQVEMVDGLVRVVSPMPDTPAARAGLQTGDLIVQFDGHPVHGMSLPDAIARMRGAPGTPITLTIRREGSGDFAVSLVRETIRTQVLRWSMEHGVLVLRLASFTSGIAAAVEQAIAEANAIAIPRAVVLDLRGNGGGLIRPAVKIADDFLGAGEIVSLRGRTSANQRTWQADANERLPGVPVVVLIDGRTASAAELVAAALQENGRATILGSRSFGKGSVQSILSLGEGNGALRLTTALYHGPTGRTVQRTGVGPDIELVAAPGTEPANRRREADRPHALPGADEPLPPKARVDQSRCASARQDLDPALACALAFIDTGGTEGFLAWLAPGSDSAH